MALVYLLFAVSGSLYAYGEKTVQLSGGSLRERAQLINGVIELDQVRPGPVLALSSAGNIAVSGGHNLDLAISFNEVDAARFRDSAGNYRIYTSPSLVAVDRRYSRAGFGAVLFTGPAPAERTPVVRGPESRAGGPLVIEPQSRSALFAPNNRINDFSMEFWLHPLNLESGEEILLWTSSRPTQSAQRGSAYTVTDYVFQRIVCVASRNRLQWTFHNFFVSPDELRGIDITVSGTSAVVPRTWSHHLIRFDSRTGLIEYLVNGRSEAIVYATATGREGSEVFTPITGEGGSFSLGSNFKGLMDEFKIHNAYVPAAAVRKYPLGGGRIETAAIDLGRGNNELLRIDASGGRTSISDTRIISSEYRRNGRFRFSDHSEMQFFIRASDNPFRWDGPWQPVIPGADLAGSMRGRYVQIAVDFYPSSDGESSPYLEGITITYLPDEPPLPPGNLIAVALDGAVQLHWRNSPSLNTRGYLVYYGVSSGDYFGEGAAPGVSPIDAGGRNSIVIDGLENGVLYYFRVAAYSSADPDAHFAFHAGEFSREAQARPLRGY